ncbi:unnamed protein product [Calypogeia fissa]
MATEVPSAESVEERLQSVSLEEIGTKTTTPMSDPYRSFLYDDSEKETAWRHGGPPIYDGANQAFEQGRTQVWKDGSLERIVENLVKTWEMELSHKRNVKDHKTIDASKFTISVNGGPKLTADQCLEVGSYNALLHSSLPGEHENYKSSLETFDSSHEIFRSVFPDGFAWEVLAVYSGPPVVAFKYRHWGVVKGSFKGHEPTGKMAESVGVCVATVDDKLLITKLEVFYDPTEFLAALTKGRKSPSYGEYQKGIEGCPVMNPAGRNPHIEH